MRSIGLLLAVVLLLAGCVGVGLMGCDRVLAIPDPTSPRVDVRIVDLNLPTGDILSPFIGAVAGTQSSGTTTPVTDVDFPTVPMRLAIFNGISIQVTDFSVQYFQEDGVTPLGLAPFRGVLQIFLDGGTMSEFNDGSIAPDAKQPQKAGAVGGGIVEIQVVNNDLKSFLAGPNGRFKLGTKDTTDTDDFNGSVIAIITVRGVDINNHDFRVLARISITARIPILPISGGGTGGGTGGTGGGFTVSTGGPGGGASPSAAPSPSPSP